MLAGTGMASGGAVVITAGVGTAAGGSAGGDVALVTGTSSATSSGAFSIVTSYVRVLITNYLANHVVPLLVLQEISVYTATDMLFV